MGTDSISVDGDQQVERLRQLEAGAEEPLGHLRKDAVAWHRFATSAHQIREQELFRLRGHNSFAAYCRDRWQVHPVTVRRSIDIAVAFREDEMPRQVDRQVALWHAAQAPLSARRPLLALLSEPRLRARDIEAGKDAALLVARAGAAESDIGRAAEAAARKNAAAQQSGPARPARGKVLRTRPQPAGRRGRRGREESVTATATGFLVQLGVLRTLLGGLRAQGAAMPAAVCNEAAAIGAELLALSGAAPKQVDQVDPSPKAEPVREVAPAPEAAPAPPPPPAPAPPPAARAASPVGPVGGGGDEIDDLCADYAPAPLPSPGLVVPLPATYRDDPHFRLSDALVLGASGRTPQSGTIGRLYPGRPRVGLNLNDSFCLSTFSVPGGGKSYLCNNILQMALQPLRYLNELPRPLCAVSFHYHPGGGYEPEALSSLQPNQNVREVLDLIEDYGALPQGLSDVVLLVPRAQVQQMRRRYPQVRVFPILFSPDELGTEGWQALLGINDDNDGTLYARRLRLELSSLRGELSLASLSQRLQATDLSEQTRGILQARLDFVQPFLSERYPLSRLVKPGRLILVDVRDAWVPKKEALTLLSLVTSALGRKETAAGGLLFCFDEAHRYMGSRVLRAEIERLIRERRHLGLFVLLASQDPLSVPAELIGLSDLIALGKIQSEEWLRRIIKANGAFKMVKAHMTARMGQGRMLVWAERLHAEAVDRDQLLPVHLLQVRPMAAHHGGATHSAVR